MDDGETKKREEELKLKTEIQKAEAKERIEDERGIMDKVSCFSLYFSRNLRGHIGARPNGPWRGKTPIGGS